MMFYKALKKIKFQIEKIWQNLKILQSWVRIESSEAGLSANKSEKDKELWKKIVENRQL